MAVPRILSRDRSASMADVVGAAACLIPRTGLRRQVHARGEGSENLTESSLNRSVPAVFQETQSSRRKRKPARRDCDSSMESFATADVSEESARTRNKKGEGGRERWRGGVSRGGVRGGRRVHGGRGDVAKSAATGDFGRGDEMGSRSLPI